MPQQIKYKDEVLRELQDMPDKQILNILNIIRIIKKSIIMQRDEDFFLKMEFDHWDALSDEALQDFEGALQ